jgi:Spy/CpxP family protein refolding chaperone
MMSRHDQAPWRHPQIVITLVLVFLAGAAAGALGMRVGLHDRLHRVVSASSKAPAAKEVSDAVVQNFKSKLELSAEQTQQIALVLADYRHYYESLEDQLSDLRATGKSRILQVLNPEQRVKFEKMMAELAPQLQPDKK